MKALFLEEAKENKVFPIGAGIWLRIHPEDRVKTPYTSWQFDATTTRMPEFTAPGLGRESNHVTIDAELGENASGVLYALGGASGGLTLYMDKGALVYEYNMMIIERYTRAFARASSRRASTRSRWTPRSRSPARRRRSCSRSTARRSPARRSSAPCPRPSPPARPSTSASISGSPVSLDYFDRRPFRFDGTISVVDVRLK